MQCCPEPAGYDEVFTRRFSRLVSRRYESRGLSRLARRMVDFLESRGVEGSTVLDIGGGVGDIPVELLRHGAGSATTLELSSSYDDDARELIERYGLSDRVTRRALDIARSSEEVEPADVVVLHRVVCCYPDHVALLSAAGEHARSLLVFSHPTSNVATHLLLRMENAWHRVRGREFRAWAHDPAEMVRVVEGTGLRQVMSHRGPMWSAVGFERVPIAG
ncbi:methyltransferase domain-containing protein [Knoellia locipacati]|uniref:class I SAM-dependent methyltransferase n=1 Tax=Knoellia locipacati TaxID=882824 RepID=UPI003850FD09